MSNFVSTPPLFSCYYSRISCVFINILESMNQIICIFDNLINMMDPRVPNLAFN